MPYFFILPAFVVWVVAVAAAILFATLWRPAAHLRPYLTSVLAWSSVGFVLSTLAYAGVLVAAVVTIQRLAGSRPSTVGGVLMAVVIFIGPFVAAALGLLGGVLVAIRRVRRHSQGV